MADHPTAYVKNEFVGGCDIIEELSGNGELADVLKSAYPDREFTPPPPPAEVQEVSSVEASEILKNQPEIAILDVRPPEERERKQLSTTHECWTIIRRRKSSTVGIQKPR